MLEHKFIFSSFIKPVILSFLTLLTTILGLFHENLSGCSWLLEKDFFSLLVAGRLVC